MTKHARVLSEDELQSLLDYVHTTRHSERNTLIVYLSHYAGMRVGEIAGLCHKDIGVPTDRCNGPAAVKQIQLRKRDCKGSSGRSVFLSTAIQVVIGRYFDKIPFSKNDFLCSTKGGGMSNVTLAQEMWKWYRRCGLDGASSHSGRRGFVTGLLNRQVSVRVVQKLVGHSFLSSTQRYADTLDSDMVEAVEKLQE